MKIKHQFTDLHKDSKKRSKICLLCASLCMFTFTGGYAQTGKVSLNLNNASVKELFTAIEKQTPYRFSYRDVEVNGKTGISLSVKDEELKDLLTSELAKQNLSYKVSGNKIVITPIKKKSDKKQPTNISGKVVDANGEPIIGATIKEEGTSNGAITDLTVIIHSQFQALMQFCNSLMSVTNLKNLWPIKV